MGYRIKRFSWSEGSLSFAFPRALLSSSGRIPFVLSLSLGRAQRQGLILATASHFFSSSTFDLTRDLYGFNGYLSKGLTTSLLVRNQLCPGPTCPLRLPLGSVPPSSRYSSSRSPLKAGLFIPRESKYSLLRKSLGLEWDSSWYRIFLPLISYLVNLAFQEKRRIALKLPNPAKLLKSWIKGWLFAYLWLILKGFFLTIISGKRRKWKCEWSSTWVDRNLLKSASTKVFSCLSLLLGKRRQKVYLLKLPPASQKRKKAIYSAQGRIHF